MPLFGSPNVSKLAAKRDLPRLIKALSDSPVRGEAALALGQLHDARAVEPLIGALDDKGRVRSSRCGAGPPARWGADGRSGSPC